jgi:hypothetical protein
MTTDEHEPGAVAEVALKAAAASLHEQLEALDEAVAYHEQRARELRETRKRVKRVQEIVDAPPDGRRNNGGSRRGAGAHTDATRAAIAERTKRRHAEERQAKKDRLRVMVQAMGPGVDIAAVDLLDEFNEGTAMRNDPRRLGRQLAVDLLRELRDEGTLRLDRTANGGKAYYRLVAEV